MVCADVFNRPDHFRPNLSRWGYDSNQWPTNMSRLLQYKCTHCLGTWITGIGTTCSDIAWGVAVQLPWSLDGDSAVRYKFGQHLTVTFISCSFAPSSKGYAMLGYRRSDVQWTIRTLNRKPYWGIPEARSSQPYEKDSLARCTTSIVVYYPFAIIP